MELNGALSNPGAALKRVGPRIESVHRTPTVSGGAPAATAHRRQGSVLATTSKILQEAKAPLQIAEIHEAVEKALDVSVPRSTVKAALATHAHDRFQRVRRGSYRSRG
jgi:hypothetical protein